MIVISLLLVLKENLLIICLSVQGGVNSVMKCGLNSSSKNPPGIRSIKTP